MALVPGRQIIAEFKIGDQWLPFACVQEVRWTETTEMLPTTTGDSGDYKTVRPRQSSWGGSMSGVLFLTKEGKFTSFDLYNVTVRRNGVVLRLLHIDKSSAEVEVLGQIFFSSKTIVGAVGQIAKWDLEFVGSGPYTKNGGGGEQPGLNVILDMNGDPILDLNGQAILDI